MLGDQATRLQQEIASLQQERDAQELKLLAASNSGVKCCPQCHGSSTIASGPDVKQRDVVGSSQPQVSPVSESYAAKVSKGKQPSGQSGSGSGGGKKSSPFEGCGFTPSKTPLKTKHKKTAVKFSDKSKVALAAVRLFSKLIGNEYNISRLKMDFFWRLVSRLGLQQVMLSVDIVGPEIYEVSLLASNMPLFREKMKSNEIEVVGSSDTKEGLLRDAYYPTSKKSKLGYTTPLVRRLGHTLAKVWHQPHVCEAILDSVQDQVTKKKIVDSARAFRDRWGVDASHSTAPLCIELFLRDTTTAAMVTK
jgi:hypothetical protein